MLILSVSIKVYVLVHAYLLYYIAYETTFPNEAAYALQVLYDFVYSVYYP
jgi:hypothetical protein